MIAALFVATGGCYFGLPGVDPWDRDRDALQYEGPDPVVAHPPCERWGRYWYGGPMLHKLGRRKVKGADGGCFARAADGSRMGGVVEHPEASHAWGHFGLAKPPHSGGWIPAGDGRGWTCCVEQGHYGHRARKKTWLYAVSCPLSALTWGPSAAGVQPDAGFHSKEERRRHQRLGTLSAVGAERMGHAERAATPTAFRDLLLSMVRDANVWGG